MVKRTNTEFLDRCEEILKTHAIFGWLTVNRLRVLAGRPFLERESFGESDWRQYKSEFIMPLITQAREKLKASQ